MDKFTCEALTELFDAVDDMQHNVFSDEDGYWLKQVGPGMGMAVKIIVEDTYPVLDEDALALMERVVMLTQVAYLHGMKAQKEAVDG